MFFSSIPYGRLRMWTVWRRTLSRMQREEEGGEEVKHRGVGRMRSMIPRISSSWNLYKGVLSRGSGFGGCHLSFLTHSPRGPWPYSRRTAGAGFATRRAVRREWSGAAAAQTRAMPTQTAERCSFAGIAPLEAILFDIDGTLCDSDPIHYFAFREMLQEVGYNNGEPITEEFFVKNISGGHNDDISRFLFPDWDREKAVKFMDDKEALFRRLAAEKIKPVDGLHKLCQWISDRGLKHAAVTNAPRPNAELMISCLGLSDFFDVLIIGGECEHAKPFPDPYLKALKVLGASACHTFIFEDSASGIKAGVAAGMPVVGLTTRNPDEILLKAGAAFLIKNFEDPKLWMALEEEEKAAVETVNT